MVYLKRKHIEVKVDRRKSTRIEFHFPIVILGIDDSAQIVDFSLDGFYIEISTEKKLTIGQLINIALKLPIEKDSLRLKAQVIYNDKLGIGCRFVDLSSSSFEKLERTFDVFNATLPIE